jgi:hypothetical protein
MNSLTPQQLLGALVPKFSAFSMTKHVGGKLRALYDDDAHALPDRLTYWSKRLMPMRLRTDRLIRILNLDRIASLGS